MMLYIQELQTEQISRSPYLQQMKPKQSIVDTNSLPTKNRRNQEINHINNPSAIQPSDQINEAKGYSKKQFFSVGSLELQKVRDKGWWIR